ncbi:MAG: NifU family protein [Phycisphaerales bacterium]|nr:NifU family protein [Phycisphaerales bacterium]
MIKTGNPVVSIYIEPTPNPETMKFVANILLYPGKVAYFESEAQTEPSLLAKELFRFPFIKNVFIASNFITLGKINPDTNWDDVVPIVKQFLKEYLESGKMVINEELMLALHTNVTVSEDDDEIIKRIKELLENYVKPAVEMDGGAIHFKSYDQGIVSLTLQGSCNGCPSSMITLKAGIEGMMKRLIPEVKEVIADGDNSDNLGGYMEEHGH